jgi:hypothetical protein
MGHARAPPGYPDRRAGTPALADPVALHNRVHRTFVTSIAATPGLARAADHVAVGVSAAPPGARTRVHGAAADPVSRSVPMRLSRQFRTAPLVFAVACASAGSSSGAATATVQTTTPIIGGSSDMNGLSTTTRVVSATTTRFSNTADQVFSVMPAVYGELKIPVTTMVTKDRIVGNNDFRTRRVVGGMPMRRLLDCGGTAGDPNADTYEIFIDVSSEVKADGAGEAVLATVFQANGRPVSFAGNDVRCTSTGELESKIAALTKLKLSQLR